MRVAPANELPALPEACWPGAGSLSADIEPPGCLEFPTRYAPTQLRPG